MIRIQQEIASMALWKNIVALVHFLQEMMRRAYSFIIGSRNADCNTVAAALRNKLGARGGGKPVMVQGSVKAAKSEIEEVLKEVL